MNLQDLDFQFPEQLIAIKKSRPSRVMWVGDEPVETTVTALLSRISPDDVFVINETKVIKCRLFTSCGMEILFLNPYEGKGEYQVLCPAKKWPKGKKLLLPGNIEVELVQRGLPQTVKTAEILQANYFETHGHMPLPPYIQKARGQRGELDSDPLEYQTGWAKEEGSLAAPTASLHFTNQDMDKVTARGAEVHKICLHVGLGTFLPIHSENLDEHEMHGEQVSISKSTWQAILACKKRGGKVWALGTTVTRALESKAQNLLEEKAGEFVGNTHLFLKPGDEIKIVDVLLTNFHQPKTTLVALVAAFAGLDNVKSAYAWAFERGFQLFSYGDLTVWEK